MSALFFLACSGFHYGLFLADNVRISDFGLATVFRYKGEERLLMKKCGTLPYIAPEVLVRNYHAQPADIWSCGVILVALLAGGDYCFLLTDLLAC